MISSWSAADGISLSLSTSQNWSILYSSLIFVDNKITSICLLTLQQLLTVSACNTQVILLSGEFCIFQDESVRQIRPISQSSILPVTFAKCLLILKILSSADRVINL